MSHINKKGNPYIIDISNKDVTERVAVASGEIKFDKETYKKIKSFETKKGNLEKTAIIGGVESMSNIPFLFQKQTAEFFTNLSGCKTILSKIKLFSQFKLKLLKPIIGLEKGLTDPTIDMIMGETAEILAKEFAIFCKIIVLPAFGGEIINDLCPLPIGLTKSINLAV